MSINGSALTLAQEESPLIPIPVEFLQLAKEVRRTAMRVRQAAVELRCATVEFRLSVEENCQTGILLEDLFDLTRVARRVNQ